jgi:hypothetical protein
MELSKMGKYINLLKKEFWNNIALFLIGVLLIYIAAFDSGLFRLIAFDQSNRALVAFSTIIAVAIPTFFAIGSIKQGILVRRQTIDFYEKMLKSWAFWIVAGAICFLIAAIKVLQFGIYSIPELTVDVLCILAGTYLIYYALKLQKKPKFQYSGR